MHFVRSYSVAGLGFSIDGAPFEPSNFQPFRASEITPLFSVHVVPSLPSAELSPLYQTTDGPGFPEITLWKKADGWHRTLEGLASRIPCYHLDCLPDQAAAELCYKTIYG